jgi:hypothetical protein
MTWGAIAAALVASVAIHAIALGAIPSPSAAANRSSASLAGPCECDYEIQVGEGERPVAALAAPRQR